MKRLWLLGLVVVAACVRVVTPPQSTDTVTVKKPQGQPCGDGDECATGHCQDAVCCDRACAAVEACNLERAFGNCAPRVLGDPCGADNARCRSGFCADGVCCESACNTPCHACAEPGQEGHCALAADNTNPRDSCTAFCTACFGGVCAPALAGSDPGGDCMGGRVCAPPLTGLGPPECRSAAGGSCAESDACAAGVCLERRCHQQQETAVSLAGVSNGALHVRAMTAAVDSRGQPSVVLRALVEDAFDVGRVGRQFTHAIQTRQGWLFTPLGGGLDCWFNPGLPLEPFQEDSAAELVAVGSSQLVLLAQGSGCRLVNGILDFAAQAVWLSPTGQVSRRDILWRPNPDPAVIENVQYLSAVFDGEDTITALLGIFHEANGSPAEYLVEVQAFSVSTGAWKSVGRISTTVSQWGPVVQLRGSSWVVAANTDTTVAVYQPGVDGELAPRSAVDLPAGCTATYFAFLHAAADGDGTAALVTVPCQEEESTHALVRLDVAADGTPALSVLGRFTQAEDQLMGQAPLVPLGVHAGGADLLVFERSSNRLLFVTTADGTFGGGRPIHPRFGLLERLDLLGSSVHEPRWLFFGASQVATNTMVGARDSQVWLQTFTVPQPSP